MSVFLICIYGKIISLPPPILAQIGGESVGFLLTFLISVMAGIVANFISKRLDEDSSGNEPKD